MPGIPRPIMGLLTDWWNAAPEKNDKDADLKIFQG